MPVGIPFFKLLGKGLSVFMYFNTVVLLIRRKQAYGFVKTVVHNSTDIIKNDFSLPSVTLNHGKPVLLPPTVFLKIRSQQSANKTGYYSTRYLDKRLVNQFA